MTASPELQFLRDFVSILIAELHAFGVLQIGANPATAGGLLMCYLSREPYIDVSKCELSLGGVESGIRVGSATTISVALKDQHGQPAVPAQPLEVT